eukprot:TRINITY_DN1780_c0_g1_i2.p1 TRINITY_DN1780_c0_g1~~TRINITY_DN1780_c0_g1_i2.p1  ORF type:complete len:103 (-),score=9.31 TRINITY_DN1780_c0_g1_i2:760-1026(-)
MIFIHKIPKKIDKIFSRIINRLLINLLGVIPHFKGKDVLYTRWFRERTDRLKELSQDVSRTNLKGDGPRIFTHQNQEVIIFFSPNLSS